MQKIVRTFVPFTPILLAVFPVLYLFQHNQTDLPLRVLWGPLAVSAAIGVTILAISRIMFKPILKSSLFASLFVIAIFYYGFLYDVASGWSLNNLAILIIWLILHSLGIAKLLKANDLNLPNQIFFVGAAYLILVSIVPIGLYRIQNPPASVSDPRLWSAPLEVPQITASEQLPDIYYIVPDDYARTDVLKEHLGYDNSQFIRELESRGFVIQEQSRSPYSNSISNMASALNLDYLNHFADVLGENSQNTLMVTQTLADNRASHFLESLGYQYIHIDSDHTTYPGENPTISPIAAPDSMTYVWLQASILRSFGGEFGFNDSATDERFRQSVLSAFDKLKATPEIPGPKFVFFHTLIPHDPFVFGASGERVTFFDPTGDRHDTEEGIPFYVEQLQFSSQLLLESIDAILANSKTPPIIILQADEGFEVNEEVFGKATVEDIRVKGISAFYIPSKDVSGLPQNLNSVNTFRYLFDLCFGTHFGMLENASYRDGDFLFQPVKLHVIGDPDSTSP